MKFSLVRNGILFAAVAAFSAQAAQQRKPVEVDARAYYRSCSYYTGHDGDAWVRYTNPNLPWGSKVTLIWSPAGYRHVSGGQTQDLRWHQRQETLAEATEAHTWTTPLHLSIRDRTGYSEFWDFDFVFKITWPDGRETFDNGGLDPWGYYHVTLKNLPSSVCLEDAMVQPLEVTPVKP